VTRLRVFCSDKIYKTKTVHALYLVTTPSHHVIILGLNFCSERLDIVFSGAEKTCLYQLQKQRETQSLHSGQIFNYRPDVHFSYVRISPRTDGWVWERASRKLLPLEQYSTFHDFLGANWYHTLQWQTYWLKVPFHRMRKYALLTPSEHRFTALAAMLLLIASFSRIVLSSQQI
jgi:hypothetical protein